MLNTYGEIAHIGGVVRKQAGNHPKLKQVRTHVDIAISTQASCYILQPAIHLIIPSLIHSCVHSLIKYIYRADIATQALTLRSCSTVSERVCTTGSNCCSSDFTRNCNDARKSGRSCFCLSIAANSSFKRAVWRKVRSSRLRARSSVAEAALYRSVTLFANWQRK